MNSEPLPKPRKRKFVQADLTELQDEGVLLAANESFFWPLGLALTWNHDLEAGVATELYIYQWDPPDVIELDSADLVGPERRRRFFEWKARRPAAFVK